MELFAAEKRAQPEEGMAKIENRSPLIGRVETMLLDIGAVIEGEIKYSAIAEAYETEQKLQSQSKRAAPEF